MNATLKTNQILTGDCKEVLKEFPNKSIDLCIFSPPYYGLRDYGNQTSSTIWDSGNKCKHEWIVERTPRPNQAGGMKGQRARKGKLNYSQAVDYYDRASYSEFCMKCGAWKGQLGLEPNWRMYIKHLTEICREIKRVLKRTGSMYIVIGDTYTGSHCGKGDTKAKERKKRGSGFQDVQKGYYASSHGEPPQALKQEPYQPKCLMGIPWRLAFSLIEDGWILRNDIIWHKPNAMPSSVKDRLTNTYDHIFHFVKARRYYYDLDAIREPQKVESLKRYESAIKEKPERARHKAYSPLFGAGSQLRKERAVLGAPKYIAIGRTHGKLAYTDPPRGKNPGDFWNISTKPFPKAHFAVYPIEVCLTPILSSCPPGGVVLDPMCGSGTTLLTCELINRKMWNEFKVEVNEKAKRQDWNLKWIGIEINPEYCEIAKERLRKYTNQERLTNFINLKG